MKKYQEEKIKRTSYSTYFKTMGVAICILVLHPYLFAQNDSGKILLADTIKPVYDSAKAVYDSATSQLFQYVKQFGDSERRKNEQEYIDDTVATRQDETIELIRRLMLEAQSLLENGIDTAGLNTEINKIERWYTITSDGVFTNTGTIQTHRNLETSYKIIRELLTRMVARKGALDDYYKNLVRFRNTIDSLYRQNILYQFSSDSLVLMRYVQRLSAVSQQVKPIVSSLKQTIISVSELQPVVNRLVNKLNAGVEQIAVFQQQLSSRTFNRETSNLGSPARYVRQFNEILSFSMIKGWLSFVFYIRNEAGQFIFLLVLILLCTVFFNKLKQNLQKQNMLIKDDASQAVLAYPLLSSVVIVLNCWQFAFDDPPLVLTSLIWIFSSLSLTMILGKVITRYWLFAWLTLFIFFLIACFVNLILQASRPERWMMLALSVTGIAACSVIILQAKRNKIRERVFIWFIGFVVIMQLTSIIANMYGRYNLSKTCLTAGFFNVVLAMLFFWTLRFINQALSLAAQVYRKPGKKLFNINFERVGDKAPKVFYVLLFFGWFVLFARNFYAYKLISTPVKNFIFRERVIGEFSFTIGNVLEFFLILYVSGIISRIVSFFASDKTEQGIVQKGGVGSWLLIIRIAIFSIGVLIAFAAVGIPMDRLTIILSALSVGVGFGLQTLVNNLVSGLIISFEKPVSVGDIIEIGNESGTVKSIGFRSSIITTIAGADVVIPNGDLLNHHLVNWTRETNSRRVEIAVGVAYGTELEAAIKILKDLPANDERVLSSPPPGVIVTQLNTSSIDMQLFFWVRNIRQWTSVKTDIIIAIHTAFKKHSIKIPFPQQELYINSEAGSVTGSETQQKQD